MMNHRRGFSGLAAALFVIAAVSVQARQPDAVEGAWIIELESPPVTEFRGGEAHAIQSASPLPAKSMAATAPEVTGAARLDVASPEVRAYAGYLDGERESVLAMAANQLGRDIEPDHVYRYLFNGFAVSGLSRAEAARLAAVPGVRSVTRETIHYPLNDAGHLWIGADRFWAGAGFTGANRGEGMVLGVVDTGINWESPAFQQFNNVDGHIIAHPRPGFPGGLCIDPEVACNNKLIGVYDFSGGDTKGRDRDGHGSHVSSSAAGNRWNFDANFGAGEDLFFATSGVAPRASLIAYKACRDLDPDDPDDNGGCTESALLAALDQVLEDGVDVLNYSLGTTSGEPPSPWRNFDDPARNRVPKAMLNLRAAGIVVVTSGGNGGPGPASMSSPANAPWVLSVGNVSHDRVFTNNLVETTGGPFALGEILGLGITGGVGPADIVHAADFGNALCGTGEPELASTCEENTGATNPFAPGTFDGKIVVCDRGEYGRVEKGFNVMEAGAVGYILANTAESGESIQSDRHCLPGTHVGAFDGDRLRDWLASGSNHRGRLTGFQRQVSEDFGGFLAASSSRGPNVEVPGVMKPNVVAPGTNILGAGAGVPEPDPNALLIISGTSMASPHAAGAALLLRKARPEWSVDAIISALETTARPDAVLGLDGSAAQITGRGAGGIRVDDAVRIGLFLPVTNQQFIDANPATGGDPGALNLPGMVDENCVVSCTFTRRVRALSPGSWSVTTEGELDIEVEPGAFTLASGQEQVLTVTVRPGAVPIGAWGHGSVVLDPGSGSFIAQRLPVGAFISEGALPADSVIAAERNRGQASLLIDDLAPMPEAVFRTSALVLPERTSNVLPQDPDRDDPFSGDGGTFTILVDVPADALMLYAETLASTALDVDLFVGRDDNGNGQADPDELRCQGISPDELEKCVIDKPESGSWWILVQNWLSSSPGALDEVTVDMAVLTADDEPSFVASGPGFHPGGPLTLPVYWDQPAMRQAERWLGALGVSTRPDFLANVGVIPVEITRNSANLPQDTALFNDQTRAVVLPPATSHEHMFIDVPSTTTGLVVELLGSNVNISLRRRSFADLAGFEPNTPSAPPAVITSAVNTGNGATLSHFAGAGQTLIAGRYYVVLENPTANEVRVDVVASIIEPSGQEPRRGLWEPLNRTTWQGIEWNVVDEDGFVLWYTYEEDTTSAFYITDAAAIDAGSSAWSAPLLRVTSNQLRQTVDVIGEVSVTALAEDDLILSWRFNGHHGSERLTPITGASCPTIGGMTLDLQGTWFPPGVAEGGASVAITPNAQAWIRYYFDQFGIPRWVQVAGVTAGAATPETRVLDVLDFRGFCPYCAETERSLEVVGVQENEFFSELSGHESIDFVSRPPLATPYSTDRTIARLSSVRPCP